MKIGVVGNGFIGRNTKALFKENDIICYDILSEKSIPTDCTINDIVGTDIIFISVPTPITVNGGCDISIIEETIKELRKLKTTAHIIVRSTINPGISKHLACHYMPIFTTRESHCDILTFSEKGLWYIGYNQYIDPSNCFKKNIQELFTTSKDKGIIKTDTIIFTTVETLEIAKYARNSFLAAKVSIFNEFHSYIDKLGLDYNEIRNVICDDNRIGESHTNCPGPDGKKGFAGTGLMNDLLGFCLSLENIGVNPVVMRQVLTRNISRDRVGENWYKANSINGYSRDTLLRFTTNQLQNLCKERSINFKNCVEKTNLVDKLLEFENEKTEQLTKQQSTDRSKDMIGKKSGKMPEALGGKVHSKPEQGMGGMPGMPGMPRP